MSKHKEVTFWVAGINNGLAKEEDKVVVVEATFIETDKQYRLKKEDSKEFRFAARFLQRAIFDKKNNTLCATRRDALQKLSNYFLRSARNSMAQVCNYTRLETLVSCALREDNDA